MTLRPFEFISLDALCRPVSTPADLDVRGAARYTALTGMTIVHQPPRYVLDDDDLSAPGQTSPEPMSLRGHAVRSDDTVLATLTGATVEKLARTPALSNTFNVFVDDGVAVAESFHSRQSGDYIAQLMGETATAQVGGAEIHVKLREVEPPGQIIDYPCILMASRYIHHNYYHWIMEGLPRLWALAALADTPGSSNWPLAFPSSDLKPYHLDILRALGVPNPILPLRTRLTRFESLVFPTFLDPSTVTPRQIAWLRDMLFRAFPAAAKRDGPRRILVSRRDAKARRLTNEAELAARLEPLGFVCVTPGALPVAEQIRLFASAEVVVAPHGAGNVNMAFCSPDAAFLELVPAGNASSLYWMMANVCGLRYGRQVCFEDNPGFSMIADVERTLALVDAALGDR